jgi:hypothetical protein
METALYKSFFLDRIKGLARMARGSDEHQRSTQNCRFEQLHEYTPSLNFGWMRRHTIAIAPVCVGIVAPQNYLKHGGYPLRHVLQWLDISACNRAALSPKNALLCFIIARGADARAMST